MSEAADTRTASPNPHLRIREGDNKFEATNLELFFDLVFVFAITQLSHKLLTHLTLAGAAQTGFILLVVWWAWVYTTWMTNWFDPNVRAVRVVLVVGMLASLLMAVAIPKAFGSNGLLFAGSYVALQVIRNAFVLRVATRGETLHNVFKLLLSWSVWVSLIWILGGLLHGEARVVVWVVALVADYAGPAAGYWTPRLGRAGTKDWEIEGGHFAERFQLFVIIALGESIVVTGATAANSGLTSTTTFALVTSFVLTVTMWWLYFDLAAERSQQRLASAENPGRLARDAFTYMHLPIIAGIVLTAVANGLVIAHPGRELSTAGLLVVGGGPALYLIGLNLFRRIMAGTYSGKRAVTTLAVVVVTIVAAATSASGLVAAISVAAVLLVLLGVELKSTIAQNSAIS